MSFKEFLDFLSQKDHFLGFIVAMAVFFAGVAAIIRAFRKNED